MKIVVLLLFFFSFAANAQIGVSRNVKINPADDPRIYSVKLERTTCFGTCPAFQISITADGNVEYEGFHYVKFIGSRHGKLDSWEVEQLFEFINDIEIFGFRDKYTDDSTDAPTEYLTVTMRNGKVKKITNYANVAPKTIWAVCELIAGEIEKVQWEKK